MRRFLIAALVATATWIGVPAANAVCAHTHPDGSFWVHSGTCETFPPPPKQHAKHGGNGHGRGHEPGSARRDGPGYLGGCAVDTANDTSPDGTFGGENVWNGQVNILVATTTPGDTVDSASCWIRVNGGAESQLLNANVAGGVGAGAGRATFTAAVTDVVSVCTHVDLGSVPTSDTCVDLTTTAACPDQGCGDGGLIDQTYAVVSVLDPTTCAVLATLAPTVDSLTTTGVVRIDPATGDTSVGGTGPTGLHWDCPPNEQ